MFLFAIAFMIGDVYLQTFSKLPSIALIEFSVIISLVFYLFLRKRGRYAYLPLVFVIGFAWSAWYASVQMSWSLPSELEGKTITVIGDVASLPVIDQWQTSFILATEKTRIRLSWRNGHKRMVVGDQWRFQVRLKRIHGTQNPGAFDFDAWALQKGLRASGYVVAQSNAHLLSHAWYRYPIDHLRQKLQQKIQLYSPHSSTSPWLMALIIGEREGIAQENWRVLQSTGTNHLMAIAGLHIGIIAGFAYTIITWIWRRVPRLVLRLPAQLAGSCAALLTALFYSALSGFAIPTQRACLMLVIFIVALLVRRKISAWHAWSIAMLGVLLLNPLCILTESFWLSFSTIALIIYGMGGRLAPTGFWWKWGRVQWVIGVGLIPLTLMLFQQASLISLIANSIAIPWLGFLILPFCFLSGLFFVISPTLGCLLLHIADKSLSILWPILTWLSHEHFSVWHQAMPSHGLFALAMFGFAWLLLPAGFPGRWIGVIWLLPLLLFKPEIPRLGDYWITLLDVGQGLSVVVQTQAHTLVFDAGPKYSTHSDMGESVVLPYLRMIGVKKIDSLVISHGDNDHIGGAPALLRALPVSSIKTSVPDDIPSPLTSRCQSGDAWQWDQVHFTFLHPTDEDTDLDNDGSCVLRVDNGSASLLLTGDIEKHAEKSLLARFPDQLASDILVAPHHGSKTSAVQDFILTVHPRYVIYATGYRNRYHFPHPSVVGAYENIHAHQLNTAASGAILFKAQRGKKIIDPVLYRVAHHRYWFG